MQRRNQVHNRRCCWVPEVGISGIQYERVAFKIDIDAVETIVLDDAANGSDEIRQIGIVVEQHGAVGPTDGEIYDLALGPGRAHFGLKLSGSSQDRID